MIIAVVGQPRSGKDTISRHWTETRGFREVHLGNMIRAWAEDHNHPLQAREDFVRARAVMEQDNPNVFVDAILRADAEHVCVNGLRVVRIAETLRVDHGAKILGLECSPRTRYLRALKAPDQEGKRAINFQDFLAQEAAESDSVVVNASATLRVMQMADHTIRTDVPIDLMLGWADDFLDSQPRSNHSQQM